MTVDDMWAMPRVGSPEPSPDGKWIAVTVSTASMEENKQTSRIWLVPSDAKKAGSGGTKDPARPLTAEGVSSSQPAWSPDGRRVLYVRKPGGEAKPEESKSSGPAHPDKPQLYLLSLEGGEPERLTDLPLGVADPLWFPDGRRVAFLGAVVADSPALEETAKHVKAKEKDPVKAYVTENRLYRFWDQWLTHGHVHHIFALDLETREMMDVMPDSRRWFEFMDPSGQYRIAPDGKEIAFAACRTEPPHDPLHWGVFTVKVPEKIRKGAKAPRVTALTSRYPADVANPVYSPDGKYIIFGMQKEFDFYADKTRLVAYDRKTKKHTILTEHWDGSAFGWTFARDPGTVYFEAETKARTAFYSFDLRKALRTPESVVPRELVRGGTLSGLKIAGNRMFASMTTISQPPEAFTCDLKGKGMRQVTAFTAPRLSELDLGTTDEFIFKGAEGDPVQMFVLYPPSAKKKESRKKLPLVHMIHGGPHGVFGDQWHWRWNSQVIASQGYMVAMVNFHGSTSWGQDFTASILGRWGDQPYEDVMAATDYLIEQGLADPKRIAATGGSYGGYLVSWIASQTDRFACLVNHAGVCDFQTQYASDITQGRRRSMGGEPWEDTSGMDRYNPMRHASGFKSPMLVIHGEKDYRVPYDQGIEIYNIYKAMKLPARLVCYPDENHWILKPRNSKHWYGEFLGWLDRWIGKGARSRGR
jgi:dipeptidyl aminopeptidase/acylaminoacyl peptidase